MITATFDEKEVWFASWRAELFVRNMAHVWWFSCRSWTFGFLCLCKLAQNIEAQPSICWVWPFCTRTEIFFYEKRKSITIIEKFLQELRSYSFLWEELEGVVRSSCCRSCCLLKMQFVQANWHILSSLWRLLENYGTLQGNWLSEKGIPRDSRGASSTVEITLDAIGRTLGVP